MQFAFIAGERKWQGLLQEVQMFSSRSKYITIFNAVCFYSWGKKVAKGLTRRSDVQFKVNWHLRVIQKVPLENTTVLSSK